MNISDIDKVIIRYGDTLSAEAISFKLEGVLSPIQVKQRLDRLLQVPDALTAIQQDQMVTLKMRIIIAELEEQVRTTRNAEVMLAGLERIGNRLDKRKEANEAELQKHYAFEANALVDGVIAALGHLRGLATAGIALTEEQWDRGLESAIRYAEMTINGLGSDKGVIEAPEADPVTITLTPSESLTQKIIESKSSENRVTA